jgi:hypothetical protein
LKKDEVVINMDLVVEMLEPKIGVTTGEGAPQDQDCKRLGKGRIVTKDL